MKGYFSKVLLQGTSPRYFSKILLQGTSLRYVLSVADRRRGSFSNKSDGKWSVASRISDQIAGSASVPDQTERSVDPDTDCGRGVKCVLVSDVY